MAPSCLQHDEGEDMITFLSLWHSSSCTCPAGNMRQLPEASTNTQQALAHPDRCKGSAPGNS